ncbi:MAG: hypothetical protein QOI04_2220 [Verrucomicrobiota bacterium]|jgi:hypothetical protein
MSSLPAALAAILLIWAAGFGVAVRLLRGSREIEWLELSALAWFFGTAVVSLSLWLVSFVARGVVLQIFVTLICLALAVSAVAQMRRRANTFRFALPKSWIEFVLAGLLAVEIAVVFFLSLRHTLGWDGLLIWELKARLAWLNGGTLPAAYFADVARGFSHPEYPLFLPMNEMWLYLWMGEPNQYWIKLIFPIFYGAGMVLLARAAFVLTAKRWIGLLVASLFLFVPWIYGGPGGIVVGYVDVPLGFFYLGAIYSLVLLIEGNAQFSLAFFVAFNSILPWIKREGVILWLVAGIFGAVVIWKRRGLLLAIASLVPGAIVVLGFRFYLHVVQAAASLDFVPVSTTALGAHLDRIVPIFRELIQETCLTSHWSVLWMIVLLAFVAAAVRGQVQRGGMIFALIATPLAFYCSTYLFSAWPDYIGHIESSLPRLLIQLIPTAWLLIALALAPRNRSA